jgi:hypothetical protein
MSNTNTAQLLSATALRTTAPGIANANQLVEFTPSMVPRVGVTAAPYRLIVVAPFQAYSEAPALSPRTPLTAAKYPVLAEIWDNDEDDIFDTV